MQGSSDDHRSSQMIDDHQNSLASTDNSLAAFNSDENVSEKNDVTDSMEETANIGVIHTICKNHVEVPEYVDIPCNASLGTQIVLSPLSQSLFASQHRQPSHPSEADPLLPSTEAPSEEGPLREDDPPISSPTGNLGTPTPPGTSTELVVPSHASSPPTVQSKISITLRTPPNAHPIANPHVDKPSSVTLAHNSLGENVEIAEIDDFQEYEYINETLQTSITAAKFKPSRRAYIARKCEYEKFSTTPYRTPNMAGSVTNRPSEWVSAFVSYIKEHKINCRCKLDLDDEGACKEFATTLVFQEFK